MSYAGISVREAMEKLNSLNGGWYLPYIQRQYVWGERYESEEYICLLLEFLFLTLWQKVAAPHRHVWFWCDSVKLHVDAAKTASHQVFAEI